MKYGWIAVVAMFAALFSTGQVAAQEWGAKAAEDAPAAGSSDVEKVESMAEESLETETPKVTGFRPPGESATPGMGTQAAERERIRRSLGTVGEGVGRVGKGEREDAIPLKFNFHGYYRTRYNWIGNAPMQRGSLGPSRQTSLTISQGNAVLNQEA